LLGMVLVRQESIATIYRSTIFKTHVFNLYSHLCIFVSMYLQSYPLTHGISGLAAGIQGIWRHTWRPWWRELRDALWDRDRARLVIHLEAMMMSIGGCTCRSWSSMMRGVLGGGRQKVHLVLTLYTSVSQHPTVGIWGGDLTRMLSWRAAWWQKIL
jgi:hypothetical protein